MDEKKAQRRIYARCNVIGVGHTDDVMPEAEEALRFACVMRVM